MLFAARRWLWPRVCSCWRTALRSTLRFSKWPLILLFLSGPIATFSCLLLLLLLGQLVALASFTASPPSSTSRGVKTQKSADNLVQHARRGVGRLLGVASGDRKKYVADTQGRFWCLDSSIAVPWANVNDNYCDCADSSDEPSTSACPEGKFHCSFNELPIPSSRYP